MDDSFQLIAELFREQNPLRPCMAAILDAIPVAVVVYDTAAGRYSLVNQRAQALFGRDLTNLSLEGYLAEITVQKMDGSPFPAAELPILRTLADDCVVRHEEMVIIRADGVRVPVLVNSAPLKDACAQMVAAIVTLEDIREIHQLEMARRESEKRKAFLLRLSDRLRALADPAEIQSAAAQMLGEFLDVDNAFYVEVDGGRAFAVRREYHRPGRTDRTGTYGANPFRPELIAQISAGSTLVIRDILLDPFLTDEEKATLTAYDFRAFVGVPVIKAGHFLSLLSVLSLQPRVWQEEEITLIEEVADRTWSAAERARAVEALARSEAVFRTVLENAYEGIHMRDVTNGALIYASPSIQALTGFTEAELMAMGLSDMLARVHPDDRAEQERQFASLKENGVMPLETEFRWQVKSGEYRWFCDRRSIIRNERGEATHLVVIKRDTTGQRENENRIAFQSHLLENVHDAIIATDSAFRLTYWNEQAEKLFGYTAAEVLGHTTAELLNPILPEGSRSRGIARLLHDDLYFGEVTYHHRDGTPIQVENRARLIRDAQGRIQETVTSIRDIRPRKKVEAALQESQAHALALVDQLRESDRNKNRFISVLSHELRNPLAAIVMGLALLNMDSLDDERRQRALEMLKRQTGHLTSLVDDLLDVTRITENKVKLKLEPVELGALIRQTLADQQPGFDAKGVILAADLPEEEIHLEADAVRLNQVVNNLLHNALKFTHAHDRVQVTVCRETGWPAADAARTGTAAAASDRSAPDTPAPAPNGEHVVIRVSDTGIGIEPGILKRLFIPFTQADCSLDRTQGGLGLGLSIVKGIVELHGGQVEAASAGTGHGAAFTVRLPLRYGKQP